MSFTAVLSLMAGLALVLGLMALLVRVTRGIRPGLLGQSDPATRVEVLARQPLATRQGVAVVRFQGRTLLLSYGEGGIRLLTEEKGSHMERAGSPVALTGQEPDGSREWSEAVSESEPSFPRIWSRVRKAAGMGGLVLLLTMGNGFGLELHGAATPTIPEPVALQTQGGSVVQGSAGAAGGGVQSGTLSPEGAVLGLMRQLPNMDLEVGEGEDGLRLNGPVGTVLFIGFLTLLPTLLLMMTGFTRILVVLHLLKQAMGTQTAPPTHLLTAMALLLTGFVMAPTLAEVNRTALTPWLGGEMDELQMIQTASGPFRSFMLGSTREEDLATFLDMRGGERPETLDDIPMVVVTSAFVTSELRHAFQMGFALFLPFVVIDIVVASVLMSMGMFMLPPVMVSLPFKLLLFVLVDGWSLIVSGLVRSFA